ncbi:sensor histidine kinase [Amorphus orientalis]|uniref:histidine kinase n=1 Tax=Amorphus orientalis TaxID=649198 RepID=A0AAE4AVI9_9HYPH|nr:PAS domain-containing sensor histidine kinase [Amorphus orientalis]MDQ0316739.1 signal transduction histidine kinase [Amorphus orientalis]
MLRPRAVLAVAGCLVAGPADAASGPAGGAGALLATTAGVALLAAMGLGGLAAVLYERSRSAARMAEEAATRAEQAEALVAATDRRILVFPLSGDGPEVYGGHDLDETPGSADALADFAGWVDAKDAAGLAADVDALKDSGTAFLREVRTRAGHRVSCAGRVAGAAAAVGFAPVREPTAPGPAPTVAEGVVDAFMDRLPYPLWIRTAAGTLSWVNAAYAAAVDQPDAASAVAAGDELLDTAGRQMLARARTESGRAEARVSTVIHGENRTLDVVEIIGEGGSVGVAIDVSELEQTHAALRRTVDFHARTLDELATPVAVFGPDRRLQFYNPAYRALWDLDAGYLDSHPADEALLKTLRAQRKLPEQADFDAWVKGVTRGYQAVESFEEWWHLPDGQTLRVITNPHPHGGVTYVYENVTERLDLESRYNALIRVQSETLDHLAEGVAVFGPDGRLRLCNPVFSALWQLPAEARADRTHITRVSQACAKGPSDRAAWVKIAGTVTSLDDRREAIADRLERADGSVIDYATVPLPDGATLATFVDVTDTVKVERALKERNVALEEADRLKTAFIGHVSYQLRSPLTTIIGFTQLLTGSGIGPLNEKQREYASYIHASSEALLAIINDILDLTTIDAGIMELEPGTVDLAAVVASATEGLQDRIKEARLAVVADIPDEVGSFSGDEKRIRQVIYNLLANAVTFSPEGGSVEILGRRQSGEIVLTVSDQGRGIEAEKIDAVFDRFVSDPSGGRRRGAGLGLAIVKSFVELHGGSVDIRSEPGAGTTVTVRFPDRPRLA